MVWAVEQRVPDGLGGSRDGAEAARRLVHEFGAGTRRRPVWVRTRARRHRRCGTGPDRRRRELDPVHPGPQAAGHPCDPVATCGARADGRRGRRAGAPGHVDPAARSLGRRCERDGVLRQRGRGVAGRCRGQRDVPARSALRRDAGRVAGAAGDHGSRQWSQWADIRPDRRGPILTPESVEPTMNSPSDVLNARSLLNRVSGEYLSRWESSRADVVVQSRGCASCSGSVPFRGALRCR